MYKASDFSQLHSRHKKPKKEGVYVSSANLLFVARMHNFPNFINQDSFDFFEGGVWFYGLPHERPRVPCLDQNRYWFGLGKKR